MPEHDDVNAATAAVDAVIQPWRQGDCTIGDHGFVYRQLPDADGIDVAEESVRGLIVVSQTCDVIRSYADRPLVDVCPIVEVNDETFQGVLKRRTPRYALIPALAGQKLVADLDRTMSVQKVVLATWHRTPGWVSDDQIRAFGDCLRRKSSRFAFPDDFREVMRKLSNHLSKKHGKQSVEGNALLDIDEIRIAATPHWEADDVSLFLWFIRAEDAPEPEGGWALLLEKWLSLVAIKAPYSSVDGLITTLEDMTAKEYVDSDVLDLDHLSGPDDDENPEE